MGPSYSLPRTFNIALTVLCSMGSRAVTVRGESDSIGRTLLSTSDSATIGGGVAGGLVLLLICWCYCSARGDEPMSGTGSKMGGGPQSAGGSYHSYQSYHSQSQTRGSNMSGRMPRGMDNGSFSSTVSSNTRRGNGSMARVPSKGRIIAPPPGLGFQESYGASSLSSNMYLDDEDDGVVV